MKNPLNIQVGDTITIEAQGWKVTGEVYSVNNWTPEGYYIELTKANVPGGYSYWKERYDGGKVIAINGKKIEY